MMFFFFFQAEDGIRDIGVTGVQTCALPISSTCFARDCSNADRRPPPHASQLWLTAQRTTIKYHSVPPEEAAHFILGKTAEPMSGLGASHLLPTYARVDVAFDRGEGAWLIATNGQRYLDFASG